jgi:peptidyl-prolyl cis-trans isomerase C
MKRFACVFALLSTFAVAEEKLSPTVLADEIVTTTIPADPNHGPNEIVQRRGGVEVTLLDVDAQLVGAPEGNKGGVVQSTDRISQIVENLMVIKQLAAKGRALGLDKPADLQRSMQIAADTVLARTTMDYLVRQEKKPDFEQMAKEAYVADKAKFKSPEGYVVQHLLVMSNERGEVAAKKLAEGYMEEAKNGGDFEKMVMANSEDPGKSSNKGVYTVSIPGQFVPEFDAAARKLKTPGEFAPLIQSSFGFHVMKFIRHEEPHAQSFEEVKDDLIDKAKAAAAERARNDIVTALRSEKSEVNPSALDHIPSRYNKPAAMPAAETKPAAPAKKKTKKH